ncbi:hypothetical protein [Methylococcus sp. Mc7]|uniref:hypothetical protein n=1 Tax=Methylococcus sp. Mc7 TaxID=2860258 RepID=UPI001C5311D1|nr:hypothetical protein [Methylococcus sp. Mc7]QXP85708.1 hypothetical protein KW115_08410 [Methylococcus sp. Mc7]
MIRYARLLTLCLSVAIQLWAPLVHAHTVAGEPGGQFHIPGLEYLERQRGEEGWHAPATEEESSIVIAVENGILEQSRVSPPCRPDTPAAATVAGRIEAEWHPLELAKAAPAHPFTSPAYRTPACQTSSARGPPR